MAFLELHGVEKYFGSLRAIKGVDLSIEKGEFVVFVGPSGCGKSTLLRMIAGLETVDAGEIRIGGQPVQHLPPRLRDIAMARRGGPPLLGGGAAPVLPPVVTEWADGPEAAPPPRRRGPTARRARHDSGARHRSVRDALEAMDDVDQGEGEGEGEDAAPTKSIEPEAYRVPDEPAAVDPPARHRLADPRAPLTLDRPQAQRRTVHIRRRDHPDIRQRPQHAPVRRPRQRPPSIPLPQVMHVDPAEDHPVAIHPQIRVRLDLRRHHDRLPLPPAPAPHPVPARHPHPLAIHHHAIELVVVISPREVRPPPDRLPPLPVVMHHLPLDIIAHRPHVARRAHHQVVVARPVLDPSHHPQRPVRRQHPHPRVVAQPQPVARPHDHHRAARHVILQRQHRPHRPVGDPQHADPIDQHKRRTLRRRRPDRRRQLELAPRRPDRRGDRGRRLDQRRR